MPVDPLATLASLPASPFLVRLTPLPGPPSTPFTWRLELSEDNGDTWTSLEPGKPGYASPGLAIEAGAQAITSWRASRVDASNAEIAFFFSSGKLERRKIRIPDPDNPTITTEIDGYAALDVNGEWNESPVPIEAINKAKEKLKATK